MNTIRRLYLYAVTLISLVVITWGLIGLVRSAFSGDEIGDDVTRLAGALALIFVGIPVFLLHWLLAQRSASLNEDEQFSYIRAGFLYAALLVTLIPIVQNLMALINRALYFSFRLTNENTIFGLDQTWSDNLIAILMNSLIAAYFFSVLRKDWNAEPIGDAFFEIRRVYRFIWVVYGLIFLIGGVQQTLLYIFDTLEDVTISSESILANGLSLIFVGIPLFIVSWRIVQKSIAEQAEQESIFRAVVLFLVSQISLVAALFAGGMVLNIIFQLLLGARFSFTGLMSELRDPISVAIPFGITWVYFNRTRRNDLFSTEPSPEPLLHLQSIYEHLNAFLGLIAFFVGLQQLCFFVINLLFKQAIWSDIYRERLSTAIITLGIGFILWFLSWRRANRQVNYDGEDGGQIQRSLTRKIYLYLVVFISVMGVMISAGVLVFQVLQAVLGDPDENLLQISLELTCLLILFSIVIWYHGLVLRSDSKLSNQIQTAKQAAFPILILVPDLGVFSEILVAALSKEAPTMPVAVHVIGDGVPDETLSDAKAVILPANIATNPGEAIRLWLQNFPGIRFVLPTALPGWVWVTGGSNQIHRLAKQAAEMIRKIAEGEDIVQTRIYPAWLILVSIVAILFGLAFLITSIGILIDIIT
jgi:uncharacterized membrane protein YidH (DUF202 family)